MTIESTLSKKKYIGNGITRFFPIPFFVIEADHIFLVKRSNLGAFTINSNFRVDLDKMEVEYPLSGEALQNGEELVIYRQVPLNQIVDLENAGAFHPKVLEKDGFDRIVLQVQQVAEELSRSIKVPITSDDPPELLAEQIFEARDISLNSLNISTENAQIASQKAEQIMEQLPLLLEAKENALNQILAQEQSLSNQFTELANGKIVEVRSWAVGDILSQPEGSAKYWAEIAQSAVVGVPDATTLIKGKLLIALDSDVTAGTNTEKAITPKQLAEKSSSMLSLANIYTNQQISQIPVISDATTMAKGKVRLASLAEIEAREGEGVIKSSDLPAIHQTIRASIEASTVESPTEMAVAEELEAIDALLNTKANANLGNVTSLTQSFKTLLQNSGGAGQAYISETWKSTDSSSWYRKWSDGFIEQGGSISHEIECSPVEKTISFPLNFSTTTYSGLVIDVYKAMIGTDGPLWPSIAVKRNSSMDIQLLSTVSGCIFKSTGLCWYATGY